MNIHLTRASQAADTSPAAEKKAVGFGDPELNRRTTAHKRFFYVRSMASPHGRAVRETFGSAGTYSPVRQPARFRPPRLATGRRK